MISRGTASMIGRTCEILYADEQRLVAALFFG